MRNVIMVLLLTGILCLFMSCPEPEPDFVGTWVYSGVAEMTQTITFTTENYNVTMDMGGGVSTFAAAIEEYDEDAGHILGELESVINMGDWAIVGDMQYLTYQISGDTMIALDNFSQEISTYPSSSIFTTGTEGSDYWQFTKQ